MLDNERFRFQVKDELTYAVQALRQEQDARAADIWDDLIARYPGAARASPLALDVLLGLHRFDEAEQLMREGRQTSPGDPYFAKGLVMIAFARGDLDRTIELSAVLRKKFPGILEGYTLAMKALVARGLLLEADVIGRQVIRRVPNDWFGFLEFARLAERQQLWEEAIRRWQLIEEQFPQHMNSQLGIAQALIRLSRYDEADKRLLIAIDRFPTIPDFIIAYARCAAERDNISEATKRWRLLTKRFPQNILNYLDSAKAVAIVKQYSEAEAILREAVERFPEDPRPSTALDKLIQSLPANDSSQEGAS